MKKDSAAATVTAALQRTAIFPLALLLLVACGQKGPLQLPGQSKDTPWPFRPSAPASPPGAAKDAPGAASGNNADGASANRTDTGGPTSAATPNQGGGTGTGNDGAASGTSAQEAAPAKTETGSQGPK